ncbi:Bifunctional solanapyrone synthase [Talaromyces pinophilus]|nr:Bifunctional solanapyrone synthase [Talaromyces pinophilus]
MSFYEKGSISRSIGRRLVIYDLRKYLGNEKGLPDSVITNKVRIMFTSMCLAASQAYDEPPTHIATTLYTFFRKNINKITAGLSYDPACTELETIKSTSVMAITCWVSTDQLCSAFSSMSPRLVDPLCDSLRWTFASPLGCNINRGVLIDLSSLKTVDYDAANEVVSIGSGLRWQAVYEGLAPYERTAVGRRLLDVGVGGLLLGSELSYLSDLYGLACDNVVNFDVVLASGERVNANTTSNSDLFWALKGGANNFDIVTTFMVRTYPIGDVWGGITAYDLEYLPDVLAALDTYQSVENKDPYANLMVQAATTNSSIGESIH